MVTAELLERAQQLAGYTFKDPELLDAALTHASCAETRLTSNERLEFLGDAVLGLVVCDELYRQYPDMLEGEMTKIKSVVVSRKTCAKVADALGLTECLKIGKGMTDNGEIPSSLRAGVFESYIGALYLDGGLEITREFILPLLAEYIDNTAQSENKQNYKSHLQQYAQKCLNATPRYEALDEKGPDHSKCFEIAVVIGAKRFPSAWAPSKKEAEQRAALLALQALDLAPADED